MPMTYTDTVVDEDLASRKLFCGGTPKEKRERLARHTETVYGDFLEGWEIRTGRPWTSMTQREARALSIKQPSLMQNPGFLSRLLNPQ